MHERPPRPEGFGRVSDANGKGKKTSSIVHCSRPIRLVSEHADSSLESPHSRSQTRLPLLFAPFLALLDAVIQKRADKQKENTSKEPEHRLENNHLLALLTRTFTDRISLLLTALHFVFCQCGTEIEGLSPSRIQLVDQTPRRRKFCVTRQKSSTSLSLPRTL